METGVCTVDRTAVGVAGELGRDTEMEGGARARSDGALAGGDLAGDDRLAGCQRGCIGEGVGLSLSSMNRHLSLVV